MATMETKENKNGINIKILFYLNKERKKLCLGSRYTVKQAERIKAEVEEIARAIETGGTVGRATAGFIAALTDDLKGRFIKAGLLEEPNAGTLVALWDILEKHAEKMGYKEHTISGYDSARKMFFKYFSEEQKADTVTEKDAEEFRAWLQQQKNRNGTQFSPRTVACYVKTIKTVFNLARRARLIDRSPFEFVKKGSFANPARQFEVSVEMITDVLDSCPSQAWRVLFALWRFGGLRKMEPLLLKWDDVLWQAGKIRVRSPKTERYDGHAERYCPLFPEIRQELEDLAELAEPGSIYVVPDDIRERSENGIYNAVCRIIRRAGFTPWEKVFNNMRATRVSELKRAGFSGDQRQAWIGHDEEVSRKHYQITGMLVDKSDYDRACGFQTLPNAGEQTEQAVSMTAEVLGTKMGTLTR